MDKNTLLRITLVIYILTTLTISFLWVPRKAEEMNLIAASRGGGENIIRYDTYRAPIWHTTTVEMTEDACYGISINYGGILTEIGVLTMVLVAIILFLKTFGEKDGLNLFKEISTHK